MKAWRACLVVGAAALLGACSSSGGTRPPPVPTSLSVSLNWTPISDADDGSPVTVTGYSLAYGASPEALTTTREYGAAASSAVVTLPAGQWFFAITAHSVVGDSARSNIVAKAIP